MTGEMDLWEGDLCNVGYTACQRSGDTSHWEAGKWICGCLYEAVFGRVLSWENGLFHFRMQLWDSILESFLGGEKYSGSNSPRGNTHTCIYMHMSICSYAHRKVHLVQNSVSNRVQADASGSN